MPLTWSLDPDARFLRIALEGTWAGRAEGPEARLALEGQHLLRGDLPVLLDLRRVDATTAPTFDQMRTRVLQWTEGRAIQPRLAILAVEGLGFGIAREMDSLFENAGLVTQVFTDEDEALRWLLADLPGRA